MTNETAIAVTAVKSGVVTASLTSVVTLFQSDINYLISLILGFIASVLVLLKKYKEMKKRKPKSSVFDYISVTVEKIIIVICVVGIVIFGGIIVLERWLELAQAIFYFLSIIIGYYHEEIFIPVGNYIKNKWSV